MKDENISYIIPAYNCETTLEEAVESIFDGNFVNGDEVVIVDDCSSDKTVEIAEKLSEKHTPPTYE